MFFRIFESFRDASQDEIDSLIKQNNVSDHLKKKLKHELKSCYSMLNVFVEKSEEILFMSEDVKERSKLNQTLLDSQCCDSTLSSVRTDQLLENLNKIRDQVFDSNSKIKLLNEHLQRLKLKLNQGSQLEDAIQKKSFLFKKSFFDLIPKLLPLEIINRCMKCDKKFGLCRWKHHCRVCGNIYCSECTGNTDSFLPFYIDEVRICFCCFTNKKYKLQGIEMSIGGPIQSLGK